MGLYRAELRRLVKRRFVRYLTLAALLVLATVVVATFLQNQRVGPTALAQAERTAEQEFRAAVEWTEQWQAECERSHASGSPDLNQFPPDCADIGLPTRDSFPAVNYLPITFIFADEFPATLYTVTSLLFLVFFAAGASFVGAEWSSGAMMNLLLWRPQRLRVLFTKLAALLTGVVAVTVPAVLLWTVAHWMIGALRGSTDGVTAGHWQSFALADLRVVVLVVAAAAVGFGLAAIGRHTALALGGVLGVLVLGQSALSFLAEVVDARYPEAWLLPVYWIAWMDSSVKLIDYGACAGAPACVPPTTELTWVHTGALMAVVVALVLTVAAWTMRRRDIT
ncbi:MULTISPECIES: ABC transporter permease subunit [unclassified Solwaraspora]|uniref:ABC transporter permease subunit n=1 Tax=unclassified Solwaraspora TaxID=2627926 RepID=UPI00259BD147|nr:ABC transporter permease subunit [Solwaraspora sp. WMMA2056]WJK41038.1 ABC transporter permease subunit [Solwaraspora sp. WMMA2056]